MLSLGMAAVLFEGAPGLISNIPSWLQCQSLSLSNFPYWLLALQVQILDVNIAEGCGAPAGLIEDTAMGSSILVGLMWAHCCGIQVFSWILRVSSTWVNTIK